MSRYSKKQLKAIEEEHIYWKAVAVKLSVELRGWDGHRIASFEDKECGSFELKGFVANKILKL
jgi:hypothetical protein